MFFLISRNSSCILFQNIYYPIRSFYFNKSLEMVTKRRKPQRYRHCVIEKKGILLLEKRRRVMFCLLDSRTCLESFAMLWTIPSFPVVFTLCRGAAKPATEVCNLPVEFPAAVFWSGSTFWRPRHICQNLIPLLCEISLSFSTREKISASNILLWNFNRIF